MKNLLIISMIVLGLNQVSVAENSNSSQHVKSSVPTLVNADLSHFKNVTACKQSISVTTAKYTLDTRITSRHTSAGLSFSAFTAGLNVKHYHFGISIAMLIICVGYFINTISLKNS